MKLEAHNKVNPNCPQRHGREAHTNTRAHLKLDLVAATVPLSTWETFSGHGFYNNMLNGRERAVGGGVLRS